MATMGLNKFRFLAANIRFVTCLRVVHFTWSNPWWSRAENVWWSSSVSDQDLDLNPHGSTYIGTLDPDLDPHGDFGLDLDPDLYETWPKSMMVTHSLSLLNLLRVVKYMVLKLGLTMRAPEGDLMAAGRVTVLLLWGYCLFLCLALSCICFKCSLFQNSQICWFLYIFMSQRHLRGLEHRGSIGGYLWELPCHRRDTLPHEDPHLLLVRVFIVNFSCFMKQCKSRGWVNSFLILFGNLKFFKFSFEVIIRWLVHHFHGPIVAGFLTRE